MQIKQMIRWTKISSCYEKVIRLILDEAIWDEPCGEEWVSTNYMGEGISAAKCNRIKIGGISVVEVCFAEGITKIGI